MKPTPNPAPELAAELVKRSHDAIVLVDRDGCILYANDKARRLFGYELDELLGRTVELLVPEDLRASHARLRRPTRGHVPHRPLVSGLSLRARHKNGEVFEVEIALTPLKTEQGPVVCSTIRDLGSEGSVGAYFRNLLESAPDAMIIVDEQGAIEIINRQCESMFGYTRGELIGRSVDELLPERFRGRHAKHRRIYIGDPKIRPMGQGMELAGLRKDGTEFPVEISLSPVNGPEGLRISSVIRDVTTQKLLELDLIEARQQAERANRANTAFLAAASHDLRQPVQALSLLNGALRRTVEGPLAKEMVESQQHSLDAMTNLLNSLLDISRLDAGAIEPEIEEFPIRRLVDRLSAEFGRQASQKGLRFSGADCDARVRSDPNLLAEIIQNLVSNAIRYTETGGEVGVRCYESEGRLRMDVRDTGIGIDADELDEIFREFHKAKRQGSNVEGFGLGLAIVRRLAALLEVEIRVESEPDQGSCFSALVPLAGAGSVEAEPVELRASDASPGPGGRIVLIEDDAKVANAWRLLLKAEGFDVSAAASMAEVEEHLRSGRGAPELIISDFHLGDGKTGIDAVVAIREAFGAEIPAFIVSGDTSQVVDLAKSVSNCVLMRKPVNTDFLIGMAVEAIETGVVGDA